MNADNSDDRGDQKHRAEGWQGSFDALSEAEIASLLGLVGEESAPKEGSSSEVLLNPNGASAAKPGGEGEAARFAPGPDALPGLRNEAAELGRRFADVLATSLNCAVDLELHSLEGIRYEQSGGQHRAAFCRSLLRSEACSQLAIVDIELLVLFAMLDRLLGGSGDPGEVPRRELTEFETGLSKRLVCLLCDAILAVWPRAKRFVVERPGADDDNLRNEHLDKNDPVVSVSYRATICRTRGKIVLCLPRNLLSRIGPDTERAADQVQSHATRTAARAKAQASGGAAIELAAHLSETVISPEDLDGLQQGDIIVTDHEVSAPVVITLEGVPKLLAKLGQSDGQKAVRIVERIAPHEA